MAEIFQRGQDDYAATVDRLLHHAHVVLTEGGGFGEPQRGAFAT
jgi:aspartate/methionine/tyrosine aminotransferase